jgi:hypothetical protein
MKMSNADVVKDSDDAASAWIFIKGEGWRPELQYFYLFHQSYRTVIEFDVNNGRSFVFKAEISGSTPASTPGNTPRFPNKVKLCRDDAYMSDWRLNAHPLVQKLEAGEGEPLPVPMTAGCWSFKVQDPIDSARRVFNRYDVNGDNDISCTELKPMLAAMGYIVTDEQVEEACS